MVYQSTPSEDYLWKLILGGEQKAETHSKKLLEQKIVFGTVVVN